MEEKKIYETTLIVSESAFEKIRGYLEAKDENEYQGEDNTITYTGTFDNGYQMDVKCCGCQDEPSWTEAVLFNQKGYELCCTDPDDDFEGEWRLEYDNEIYIVNILVK